MDEQTKGQWGPIIELQNVPVHASLLPTGKILYWGRRGVPNATPRPSMNEHFTNTYIFDPATQQSKTTAAKPTLADGSDMNLFCAGHSFQPDGTLFVAGGHFKDGQGIDQACIYNGTTDTWTPEKTMLGGRWYPSTRTLIDGRIFVISGSFNDRFEILNTPQIWHEDDWQLVSVKTFPLYPRLHLTPKGHLFIAGPQEESAFLDPDAPGVNENGIEATGVVGAWTAGPKRSAGHREYAPSAAYDHGKVMYIGGGNDPPTAAPGNSDQRTPTNVVEFIDLNDDTPTWTSSSESNLNIGRQQHNATLLPDGTVLVTGGTKGTGFNNMFPGGPVHESELFDPKTGTWTLVDAESVDRCYHSTALLLPDGHVISGGGGEYDDRFANNTNAQLYKPPYFFKGTRPTIYKAPANVEYGGTFCVTVSAYDRIARASWMRLGSVTHAFNFDQSIMFLDCEQKDTTVTVHSPASASEAPPGYYMLFLLTLDNLPCTLAPIICIGPVPQPPPRSIPEPANQVTMSSSNRPGLLNSEINDKIVSEETRSAVSIGLTPLCYYGLGPCWVGAYNALQRLSNIDVVRPLPSQADSVAYVYLKDENMLPDLDVWRSEFEASAAGAYILRGIEMTLVGTVTKKTTSGEKRLILSSTTPRPDVLLEPFRDNSEVRYDKDAGAAKPIGEDDANAYTLLTEKLEDDGAGKAVQVTGWLEKQSDKTYSLHVRSFNFE